MCLAQLWHLTGALAAAALGLQTLKRASDPLGQSLTPPFGNIFLKNAGKSRQHASGEGEARG